MIYKVNDCIHCFLDFINNLTSSILYNSTVFYPKTYDCKATARCHSGGLNNRTIGSTFYTSHGVCISKCST